MVPGWERRSGWMAVEDFMARFVGAVVKEKQTRRLVGGVGSVHTAATAYADVLKGTEGKERQIFIRPSSMC